MSKTILLILLLVILTVLVSCAENPEKVNNVAGNNGETNEALDLNGDGKIDENDIADTDENSGQNEDVQQIPVDWVDFITFGGVMYTGDYSDDHKVGAECIGTLIGEVKHSVPSHVYDIEQTRIENIEEFTASFRPIGTKIYSIINSDNIAIEKNGEYIVYTLNHK